MVMHVVWRLILAAGVIAAGWVSAARAQGPESSDELARYWPAVLPVFTGELEQHRDQPRYAIDWRLDLMPDVVRITGRQTVTYTNRLHDQALDTIVFRLYPNLDTYGGEMAVGAITVDGVPVMPQLDPTRTVLTVPLPGPLPPGAQVALAMDFTVQVAAGDAPHYGQFGYQDGVLSLPMAYPVLSVYQPGQGWWRETAHVQGDAVFSEAAFYRVRVTAPPQLILAASGTAIDLRLNPDGTLTHHFAAPLMRDFTLVGSPDFVTLSGEQDGVTVRVLYRPGANPPQAAQSARDGLALVQDALRVYNRAFGPYPYAELEMVQAPNTAGGLEYAGLFVISDELWESGDDDFAFMTAHEVAHQWWYGLVGSDPLANPWIDEALAQYAVARFIRAQDGPEAYHAALDSFATQYRNYLAWEAAEPAVIGQPGDHYPGPAYFYTVYQRGPLFFRAIETRYGFDRLAAALRDLQAAFRYDMIVPNDILVSFENTLNADLDALFADWVGDFPVG